MFGMSEEAYAEMQDDLSGAYAERCKQTELDAIRADHYDAEAHVMECFAHGNLIIWDSNGKQLATCEPCDEFAKVFPTVEVAVPYVAPEDAPPF